MKRLILFFLFISTFTYAQVKVGNNAASIDPNSVLELESPDKVLVITRMSSEVMSLINPLEGALVYNTTEDCVYFYDGNNWNSLCDASNNNTTINNNGINVTTAQSAPSININEGDFWINNSDSNNTVSIWDGTSWIPIDNNPRTGSGTPTNTTAPNPHSGQIYVDETTGFIYAYDGTSWINSNQALSANNGISVNANGEIQLGGLLTLPNTVIETSPNSTLAITGLEEGDTTNDDIVTVSPTTGVLTKVTASNILREEITRITADDGDLLFNPSISTNQAVKIEVYRNGVRIDFTIVNNTTIEIEPEAACYAGDLIKIIQLY